MANSNLELAGEGLRARGGLGVVFKDVVSAHVDVSGRVAVDGGHRVFGPLDTLGKAGVSRRIHESGGVDEAAGVADVVGRGGRLVAHAVASEVGCDLALIVAPRHKVAERVGENAAEADVGSVVAEHGPLQSVHLEPDQVLPKLVAPSELLKSDGRPHRGDAPDTVGRYSSSVNLHNLGRGSGGRVGHQSRSELTGLHKHTLGVRENGGGVFARGHSLVKSHAAFREGFKGLHEFSSRVRNSGLSTVPRQNSFVGQVTGAIRFS